MHVYSAWVGGDALVCMRNVSVSTFVYVFRPYISDDGALKLSAACE